MLEHAQWWSREIMTWQRREVFKDGIDKLYLRYLKLTDQCETMG